MILSLSRLACAAMATCTMALAATGEDEAAINGAFSLLRSDAILHLRLTGTITKAGTTNAVQADAYFQQEPGAQGLAKIELLEQIRDGNGAWHVVNRVVGDGVNLYRYNFRTYEASSIQYGSPVGDIPQDYSARLFRNFSATPSSIDAFFPRLLKEIAGGTESTYRSWMPGHAAQVVPSGYLYSQTAPFTRLVQFDLDEYGNLTGVHRQESRLVGNQVSEVNWSVAIIASPSPYVPFVPYTRNDIANWRLVTWFGAAGSGF